ncbi:hypothetical protein HUX88_30335 [Duganella sp. BJB1802]|uniref:hypothetical protein n=1 Tax=Duganella sp. BJB1802 TaxID=2744575 RepID=UPI001594411C|nr:hypothetical protein [Duganella sp. BJB1802]NVD74790.1 hypothetical protein [Duganella sp. BJB1802]
MEIRFLPAVTRLMILSTVILVTACSPKIDGASFESFQTSLKKITADMAKENAKEFDADLATLMKRRNMTIGDLRGFINGMTVKDVHKAALEAESLWKEQRSAQLKAAIHELEQEESKANAQKEEVGKFGVTVKDIKGAWAYDPEGYDRPQNRSVNLSLTLQNNTSSPISELGYDLTLAIDGRTFTPDPWSYRLEKPLAVGESVSLVINDKGYDNEAYSALASRVTEKVIDAVKENPKTTIVATLKVTSIKRGDGTYLSANPSGRSGLLGEFRKELNELNSGTR